MTNAITSNEFAERIKNGETEIIFDYAKQLGVDAKTLADIARQLVALDNAKLRTRTVKKGCLAGCKVITVSFDYRYYDRFTISWHFSKDGACYAVCNGCFCK